MAYNNREREEEEKGKIIRVIMKSGGCYGGGEKRENYFRVEEKKGGYGKVKERGWCGMIRVTWVDEETTTV